MFLESPIQIALLAGLALVVFGPKKLPELGRQLGQGLGNFKRSLQEAQDEVKNAVKVETAPASPDGANLTPAAANSSVTAATPAPDASANTPKSSSG